MKYLSNKLSWFLVPLVVLTTLFFSKANSQTRPSELRGHADFFTSKGAYKTNSLIDSVFAYNKSNDSLLSSSALPYHDTVSVPNRFRLVVPSDDPGTQDIIEGAKPGDTLYFKALSGGKLLSVAPMPLGEYVVHEPGQIKQVDLVVDPPLDTPEDSNSNLPQKFKLYQNYPNPFNSTTKISYDLDRKARVNISIYDINGRRVKNYLKKVQGPGHYEIPINTNNLASGVYFYRVSAGEKAKTKKMVLVK